MTLGGIFPLIIISVLFDNAEDSGAHSLFFKYYLNNYPSKVFRQRILDDISILET